MRLITLGLMAVSLLGAQELSRSTSPRIVYKVEPQYSREARQAGLEGSVVLRIIVGADGTPRDLKVVRSLGLGLDEKAIAAVSKWHFAPATKSGEPVEIQAQIEVNFRLLDPQHAAWHLAHAAFQVPDGALRPTISMGVTPHLTEGAVNATATLTFDIDEKGQPANIHIDQASDDNWAREISEALKKWKFTPASKNGRPVSVSCTMDFVRGGEFQ